MKKSTVILIAVCSVAALAIAAFAAVSYYMSKTCDENKPCTMKFDLFRRWRDDDVE